jgi:hypothetical protein
VDESECQLALTEAIGTIVVVAPGTNRAEVLINPN